MSKDWRYPRQRYTSFRTWRAIYRVQTLRRVGIWSSSCYMAVRSTQRNLQLQSHNRISTQAPHGCRSGLEHMHWCRRLARQRSSDSTDTTSKRRAAHTDTARSKRNAGQSRIFAVQDARNHEGFHVQSSHCHGHEPGTKLCWGRSLTQGYG